MQQDPVEHTEALIGSARELREKLLGDPQRPRYHFLPPAAWMNDVNGTLFWRGRYHLFYQHNPLGAYWHLMHWGHASSTDLVHWVHHPIALAPTPDGPDREGCFSGNAVIHDGVPTLVYHGTPDGTCLATPEDDELLRWRKHPANPVIRVPRGGEPEHGRYQVYDPWAWQDGGCWYVLCGGHEAARGDTAYLFRSTDLVHWEYRHPFYRSDGRWTELGEDCAVPCFFPLGERHVLLFVSHKYGAQYYVGRYRDERFEPEQHGRMNWAGGQLIAPMTLRDPHGRQLFFGWVCEAIHNCSSRAAGWAGVMTLPRELSLDEKGRLGVEPVPELQVLRLGHSQRQPFRLEADEELTLDEVHGDGLELAVEMRSHHARRFGVKVRCSPDGAEETVIAFSPHRGTLSVDTRRSSLRQDVVQPWPCPWGVMYPNPLERRVLPFHAEPVDIEHVAVQEAPLELDAEEPLRLRVFLDRSVLEVFANGRQCVTQRLYPSRDDSVGVRLFAHGAAAEVRSLEAWEMAAAGV